VGVADQGYYLRNYGYDLMIVEGRNRLVQPFDGTFELGPPGLVKSIDVEPRQL